MKNGFNLIELMIIVAIIGMMSLIAYPIYKDYIVRVRLTEIVSIGVNYMKVFQASFASNGEIAPPTLQEIKAKTGATVFMKSYGCINGYEKWHVGGIPRDKVTYFGFDPKYVSTAGISTANLEQKCTDNSSENSTHVLKIVLDIDKLYGVTATDNGQTTGLTKLEMQITIGDEFHIRDLNKGEDKRIVGGVLTSCSLMINWYEKRLPDYYPKSTIPQVCRYALSRPYINLPEFYTL